jgi:TolA-binding protein
MKVVLILMVFCSSLAFADKISDRRTKIINIINEELSEVKRLNKQRSNRDPSLLLRMAELNLEKARLWREEENQQYLKLSEAKRRKSNKKRFFNKSSKYFKEANNLCIKITRQFKGFSRIGEVYYILGFNAKEANKQKTAIKYLSLAGKRSNDKLTKVKSQISLAEVNYNQKKYSRAIPLYEKALSKHVDKWWTKDSFNLAWSYYRVNKYSKAISKMEEIFKKSSSSKYIDMRTQVERDIGLFYASADKINDGIRFYKRIGINFTDQLLRVALNLVNQGKYARANTVLVQAEKYEKRSNKKNEIYIEQINLYEKFNKFSKHKNVADKLFLQFKKGNISKNQITTLKFQLAKVAAILQKQVISKTYKRLPKIRINKALQSIAYFEYLSHLDKKKSDEYKYLKAETAFAAGMKTQSFKYYKETFEIAEKSSRNKFKKRSMDGMIAALGTKKKSNLNHNVFVFEAYLRNWPKGRKAKDIYSRLFNNYLTLKQYENAKAVLDLYTKHYPKSYKTQEAMIANLMDIDRKNKDNKKIRAWITSIDAGKYRVSSKYKLKLKELLTTIQIEDVQYQLSKGNKKIALVGYHKINDDKYSTKRSKINAKYNLAALYYELNDTDKASHWAHSALDEMDNKDVIKFSDSFITISNFLFTSLEFDKSAKLSEHYIKKICKSKSKKKTTAIKNASFIYLADGDIKSAERIISLARKCRVRKNIISLIEYELMKELKSQKKWPRYEYYISKLKTDKYYYSKVIDEAIFIADLHRKFGNRSKVKKFDSIMWKLFYKAKKNRKAISMLSLDKVARIKLKSMQNMISKINLIKFEFPEKVFAKRQKKKLQLLTKLTSIADEIQSIGSGIGIVNSFKKLQDTYLKVANEIYAFKPEKKSAAYIKAFKNDFNQVGKQLEAAANEYKSEAMRAIKNNSILNQNNFFFQNNSFPVKFFGIENVSLMDKGGK